MIDGIHIQNEIWTNYRGIKSENRKPDNSITFCSFICCKMLMVPFPHRILLSFQYSIFFPTHIKFEVMKKIKRFRKIVNFYKLIFSLPTVINNYISRSHEKEKMVVVIINYYFECFLFFRTVSNNSIFNYTFLNEERVYLINIIYTYRAQGSYLFSINYDWNQDSKFKLKLILQSLMSEHIAPKSGPAIQFTHCLPWFPKKRLIDR